VPAGSAPRLRLIALGLLAAAVGAHADYKEDYSRGLVALKDGNYAEARQRLQKALAEQPEAAMRVRLYGQRWEPYLPQHYLGMAEYRLGNCAAALSQWGSSENQRTIGQLAEIQNEQKSASAECSKSAVAKKTDEAPKPAADATAVATTAAKPADDKRGVATPLAPVATARPAAAEATKPVPAEPIKPVAPPLVDIAKTAAKPVTAPERPSAPAENPAATAPPEALVAAFDKYLGGRYADVAAIDPGGYRDARSRYHAYLLRAAARFTLSQVSGDQALVDAAREDVRAARAANAKGAPDAVMFSPRFRAFFAQSR